MDDLISRQAAIDVVSDLYWMDERLLKFKKEIDATFDKINNLPSAQPEPQWIPVSERLPEYGTQVLAIHKDGDYELNHVIDEEDGEWFLNGVIAWMPLPEPYEEQV